jgi:CubicO group peptidase (beta-lactamase class C family)
MRLLFTGTLIFGALLSACGGGGVGGGSDGGGVVAPPAPTTVSTPTFYPGDTDIPATGADTAGIAAFDTRLKPLMKRYNLPGLGVAVTKDGKLIVARAYGYQDFEARQPMRPDTMVRVASISKFITALAIMRLRDQGQLDLDQPFLNILTDYQVAAGGDARLRDITIRMLLLHAGGWDIPDTSDFANSPGIVAKALGVASPPTCRDVIRYTMTQPLGYTPGTKIVYSNTGYCILGEVVAKLAGQTYESYVRDHVLAPADVHAMSIAFPHLSQRGPLEAKYYIYNGSALVNSAFAGEGMVPLTYAHDPATGEGAFGWLGSPVDLTRIMTAFEGTRVASFIAADSKAQMMIDTHLPDTALVGTPRYRWRGLGLVIGPTTATYAHAGLSTGSQIALHRIETGHTFSLVTNIRTEKTDDAYNDLVAAVEDAIATLPADSATDLYSQYPSMSLQARNP